MNRWYWKYIDGHTQLLCQTTPWPFPDKAEARVRHFDGKGWAAQPLNPKHNGGKHAKKFKASNVFFPTMEEAKRYAETVAKLEAA